MTILLNSEEIKKCVELNEQLIPIIEDAFKNLALGKTTMPPILRLDIEQYHGESDVKAAYINGLDSYAIKIASGFFNNPKLGLPSSNGLMILLDSETGVLKSVLLDKGYLTDVRTAIAGAIAAKYLSNPQSTKVGIIGAGIQAKLQLQALSLVRDIETAFIWARDQEKINKFINELKNLNINIQSCNSIEEVIGSITVDDVVDVIEEEREEDILKLGGVGQADIYDAVIDTTKSRFSWLLVNLLTAVIASIVIGFFQASIEKVVALAVLMPIVASMGGNAGTQTLTVSVRALAMKELTTSNAFKIIAKETLVGGINGIIFAIIIGLLSSYWFEDYLLGIVIAMAMIINLLIAGMAGIMIPITLNKFKVDPALASGVILTTITDVFGFLSFLGLASILLL